MSAKSINFRTWGFSVCLALCAEAAYGQLEATNRVIDAQGNPIVGAKVEFAKGLRYSWRRDDVPDLAPPVETDSEGRFQYPTRLATEKRFYIFVSADGFLNRHWLAGQQAFILKDGSRQADTLQLRRPATVSGKIIGPDGKPLSDVEIAFDWFYIKGYSRSNAVKIQSDEKGRFRAEGLEPTNIFVRYQIPYSEAVPRKPVGTQTVRHCAILVKAKDGEKIDNVILDLRKSNCVLEGTLLDANSEPVVGKEITANRADSKGRLYISVKVKTDDQGRFRFEGLSADEYTVNNFPATPKPVQLSPNQPTRVSLFTYRGGQPAKKDEKIRPTWGRPNEKSLVAGLRLDPEGHKFTVGDIVTVNIVAKNMTKTPIVFDYCFSGNANLYINDADENEISRVNYSAFTGIPLMIAYRLEPGHEVVLGTFPIGFVDKDDKSNSPPAALFSVPCSPAQTLRMHCDLAARLFGPQEESPSFSTGVRKLLVVGKPAAEN